MSILPGTRLGPYEILAPLGAGGMGEVWRARDTKLGRDVALKVLPEALALDPERLVRFEREARAIAALNHPNIVTVHSVDEVDGVRFITMEVVEGTTLAELIPERGLPVDTLLLLAIPLADALASAHERGVIHRDVKPGNVMVTTDRRVKVLDFGLAKLTAAGAVGADPELTATGLTRGGQIIGTVPYMSPEQVEGRSIDRRSDIFSLGSVLYQMATGKRPFTGETQAAVISAILRDTPSAVSEINPALPVRLSSIVQRCLQKDPEKRYPSAGEVCTELKALEASLAPARRAGLSRNAWMAIAAAVVLAAAAAGWLWHRASRARWALETATPEITRLIDEEEFTKACVLLKDARAILPKDPTLEKLRLKATQEVSIDSAPAGADVSIRPYKGDPNAWESLGQTPLKSVRVPLDSYVCRIAMRGFVTRYRMLGTWLTDVTFGLDTEGSIPSDMVRRDVPGGKLRFWIPSHSLVLVAPAGDYLVDRTEVTNGAYKRFVDAGGYEKREFWKQPFVKDGRSIPWEEALAFFRDTAGRPGPTTWDVGSFPKGLEKHPVAGVSWYEAAAYAEFAGKSLPSVYHWGGAALVALAPELVAPGSNFRGPGTVPVGGEGALGAFGTYDMAGNVKEWCWNEDAAGKRFILGGGFGEASYMFMEADAQSPWDRRPNYGFRCVELPATLSPAAAGKIELASRDFSKERPVSDEVFNAFKGLYAYDRGDLKAKVEGTSATDDWTCEKITFDAAYGGERVTAYLFLPKNSAPPYQTVVYFPGSDAIYMDKFALDEEAEFVMKSGRALIFPVFKGTFERRDGLKSDAKEPTVSYRDHMMAWSKDLGRSIDYLETRKDIDCGNLAYYGYSWGADVAPVMLTVESRFKAAILAAGGLANTRALPEADQINFVPRVKVPVLMVNGRYDVVFPVWPSQLVLLRSLGTPEEDKKHVVYETGHNPPLNELKRETLDWLDKYLGPVKH